MQMQGADFCLIAACSTPEAAAFQPSANPPFHVQKALALEVTALQGQQPPVMTGQGSEQ